MIRRFKWTDLDTIMEIEKEAFPKSPYSRFTFSYYASAYRNNFLVYVVEDKPVAYIIFYSDGHIISIAVKKAYRRRGIGTGLVDEVLKRTGGYAMVEVRASNEVAKKFYRHLGFSLYTIIPNYYGDEDALVMTRMPVPD